MRTTMNITCKNITYLKTHNNLGAPGTGFIITPIFVQHEGTSKWPYSDSSNNLT